MVMVRMKNIAAFQFDLIGLDDITEVSGGLAEANGFIMVSDSNSVIGFHFGATFIPQGEGILVQIYFSGDVSDEICFGEDTGQTGDNLISGSNADYIDTDWETVFFLMKIIYFQKLV